MNPDLEFIYRRRSVRKFLAQEIPQNMLKDLMESAMAAPSAVAKDPWHFIVIQDKATLQDIADVLSHGQMLRQAAAGIIVVGDINLAHDQLESYMLQDLSAAVENILLAATALGLGSCWLGVHPRPERMIGIKKLFSLPDNIVPMCGIALGWPADQPRARTRFKEERVHLEKW
jgi:nitroreductase